jgi:acyl-CoA dehydrogenase
MIFPLGRPYVVPSDKLGHEVARLLIEPSPTRDRLTATMILPKSESDPVGAIELALEAILAAEPIEERLKETLKAGQFLVPKGGDRVAAAHAAGVISADEMLAIKRARRLTDLVIRVDDFAQDLGVSEMRPPGAAPTEPAGVRRAVA